MYGSFACGGVLPAGMSGFGYLNPFAVLAGPHGFPICANGVGWQPKFGSVRWMDAYENAGSEDGPVTFGPFPKRRGIGSFR